jgi:hypothetical protein
LPLNFWVKPSLTSSKLIAIKSIAKPMKTFFHSVFLPKAIAKQLEVSSAQE